ncbi:MAG: hypothetical protein ACE5L7_11635 [Candidatus Aminicenantales bacterium]
MKKGNHKAVIPLHDELAKGTLLGILKQCGLTKNDLIDLLKENNPFLHFSRIFG